MDNGTDSLLDTYLFETNSLLDQLDELLISAEQTGTFTEDNVNEIFRSMHTIKGSSAMLEFSSLMTIAHHIEDLFFYIRENGIDSLDDSAKSELFNLMFKSTDKLRSEVEKVENNEPLDTNIDSFSEEINSLLNKISGEGNGDEDSSNDEKNASSTGTSSILPDDPAPAFVQIYFDEGCGMENLRAFMIVNLLRDSALNFRFFPSDVETNSQTCASIVEHGFFLAFDSEDAANTAVSLLKNMGNIRSYELIHNEKVKEEKPKEVEDKIEIQKVSVAKPAAVKAKTNVPTPAANNANKQSLISVNLDKLDSLMAIVGEIVITESMVTSSPELANVKLDNFLKSSRQLRKLTDDLQDIAMSLRMVPVSGVFHKMNRIVRDMSKDLNKPTHLTIIGEDTEVDKSIVDAISDPIMHIVRNSMDHGIEDNAEERILAGKKEEAEIILSASHTGSEVIISVTDDGQGMDTEKILAKAKRNNLLTKPDEEYSKREILSMLMMPGFSTNEEVTEYSGRGVGLDVVKKNVESIGGVVSITSDKGKGSCTTLKIPLTIAIVDGMEIAVGDSIFTIPISNIRQSFKAKNEDIIFDSEGHEIIKCMDEFYPVIRVHDLYNMESAITNVEDGILIWVEASDKSYCLFVDELCGEQQVVVKPVPAYLNNFNIKYAGISGFTILGDGNISIILDVANLFAASQNAY